MDAVYDCAGAAAGRRVSRADRAVCAPVSRARAHSAARAGHDSRRLDDRDSDFDHGNGERDRLRAEPDCDLGNRLPAAASDSKAARAVPERRACHRDYGRVSRVRLGERASRAARILSAAKPEARVSHAAGGVYGFAHRNHVFRRGPCAVSESDAGRETGRRADRGRFRGRRYLARRDARRLRGARRARLPGLLRVRQSR